MEDPSALIRFSSWSTKQTVPQSAATVLGEAGLGPERAASTLLQGIKRHVPAVKHEEEGYGPSM